jgi:hypothetical protein
VIAWVGGNIATEFRRPMGLFRTSWENPLPDVTITSIDYVSAMGQAAPFLVAITAE